jgi:hypothetical protein
VLAGVEIFCHKELEFRKYELQYNFQIVIVSLYRENSRVHPLVSPFALLVPRFAIWQAPYISKNYE